MVMVGINSISSTTYASTDRVYITPVSAGLLLTTHGKSRDNPPVT